MTQDRVFDIDSAVAELTAAGWRTERRWDMWRAPWGGLYRGPAGAYRKMLLAREMASKSGMSGQDLNDYLRVHMLDRE